MSSSQIRVKRKIRDFGEMESTNVDKSQTHFQHREDSNDSGGTTTVPITPQMIRATVKELQTRRVFVSSDLIGSQLKRRYPIESDPDVLRKELEEKLNCAVDVGLIAKCGEDMYCMPTLRQEASSNKTDFTAFWDRYYGGMQLGQENGTHLRE